MTAKEDIIKTLALKANVAYSSMRKHGEHGDFMQAEAQRIRYETLKELALEFGGDFTDVMAAIIDGAGPLATSAQEVIA